MTEQTTDTQVVKTDNQAKAQVGKSGAGNTLTPWAASSVATSISRSDAKLLSRSVLLEETTPPFVFKATSYAIFILFLVFVIWASLTQFAEKAIAKGEIMPSSQIQHVQHVDGGMIKDILVAEGDLVEKGEILVRLDDVSIVSQIDQLLIQTAALSLELEKNKALIEERAPDFAAFGKFYPALIKDQQDAYDRALSNKKARLGVITAQAEAKRKEVLSLKNEMQSIRAQVAALKENLDIREDLVNKGVGSKVNALEAKRAHAGAITEMSAKETDITKAEAAFVEAQAKSVELKEQLFEDNATQIASLDAELLAAKVQIQALEEQLAATAIRAQEKGRVSGLASLKAGSVIQAGATIMTVVPVEDLLLAEVQLSPKDVGHVKIGMPVLVKVDTYKFGRAGGINGEISMIAADTTVNEDGTAYFRTLVMLEKDYVGPDPASNRIIPGMTVSADIRTGEKSLIAYLARPIHVSLEAAFSER